MSENAPREFKIPWRLILFFAVACIAWRSNPDKASLEKAWKVQYAETMSKNDAGFMEKVAAKALISTSVERKDYFFFSLGEIEIGLRFEDKKGKGYAIGAFGQWVFLF
jgi:hypothetical protein